MKQIFIDRFSIPPDAIEEFIQRMNYNRNFIKNLPGFINDTAFERTDENGNLFVITIAVWENEDYLNKQKKGYKLNINR